MLPNVPLFFVTHVGPQFMIQTVQHSHRNNNPRRKFHILDPHGIEKQVKNTEVTKSHF